MAEHYYSRERKGPIGNPYETYYAVGMNKRVYEHSATGRENWRVISKAAQPVTKIDVRPAAMRTGRIIFGLGTDEAVYRMKDHEELTKDNYSSYPTFFKMTSGKVTSFVVTGNDILGLKSDGAVYKSTVTDIEGQYPYASAWVPLTQLTGRGGLRGKMSDFTVSDRYIYGVGADDGAVWRHNLNGRGSWSPITTGKIKITQVEVKNNMIFGLGTDGKVHKWSRLKWTPVTPGDVTQFVLSGSFIHGLLKDGKVWKTPIGGGGQWKKIIEHGRVAFIARPLFTDNSKL